jgi:hypothetical protein
MAQKWYQKKVFIFPALGVLIASASFAAGQITSSKQTSNPIVHITEQSPTDLPNKSVDALGEKPTAIASSLSFPQTSCGDKPTGSKDTWHPVFIDGAGIEDVRVKYCADAVATKRKDTGVETVQLASFTNRERALKFAKAVGGDVGEPTVAQANSNDEPDQPSSVGVNPGEPTVSQAEIQQQQAKIQRQQTEQAILAATNLCHEKHIKAQQKTNELRKSTSGHPDNFFSDFSNSLVEGAESTAQSDLEECLQKAQTQPTP